MSEASKCPRCGGQADRSARLLADFDAVVLRCRPCRIWHIEGDTGLFGSPRWIGIEDATGGDILGALRARAGLLGRKRQLGSQFGDLMESDINDIRWRGGWMG